LRPLRTWLTLLALVSASCYDFHITGPEDAPAVATPGMVSVTVEYRQPNGCLGGAACDEPVVFFGSWMRPGGEFRLSRDPGTFVWRGVAYEVPVNYPPRDDPYSVRVYDPFLRESCSEGFSAERIRLGGEALVRFDGGGCRDQVALAYVDDNGRGRNPY
jgi:hypothetical protein